MFEVKHKCVAPHLLQLERENLEGSSLLRIQWTSLNIVFFSPEFSIFCDLSLVSMGLLLVEKKMARQ